MKINVLTFLLLLASLNLFSQKEKFVTGLDTLYHNNGEKKIGYIIITSGENYINKIKICKKIKKDIFGREIGYGECQKYSPEQMDVDKIAYGFSAEHKKQAAKKNFELIPKVNVIFKISTESKKIKYKYYTLMYQGDNYDFYRDVVRYSYMSRGKMKTKLKYYTCLTKKGERKVFKRFRSNNHKFYRKDIIEYFKSCESKLNKVLKDMKLKDPFPYAIIDKCIH